MVFPELRNWLQSVINFCTLHTHIQTHLLTHRDVKDDLIICPMLRYSNGTDNKKAELSQRWPRDALYIYMGAV